MTPDWNLWAAQCLIEELTRLGVTKFVIAPGSRSAPLTLAADNHPSVEWYTHFDERGAGFLALGLAKASGQPAAVITTSGSAVANLLPAVVEARMAGIALVMLTADRPPELIGCGANQAIRQPGIFSHYPVAELFLEPPDQTFSPCSLLRSIDSSMNTPWPGPVHINCPFREPLYPDADSGVEAVKSDYQEAKTETVVKAQMPGLADCPGIDVAWLSGDRPLTDTDSSPGCSIDSQTDRQDCQQHFPADNWQHWQAKKGVIIAGQLDPAEGALVVSLGERLGWPVFADLQSHCRGLGPHVFARYGFWLDTAAARRVLDRADILCQFGGRLTDKKLQQWIQREAPAEHWLVVSAEICPDPDRRVTNWVNAPVAEVISCIPEDNSTLTVESPPWYNDLIVLEQKCETYIREYFWQTERLSEARVIWQLRQLIPAGSRCFVGNSLPVRLLDLLAGSKDIHWFSQRGASGIDGVLAHAHGVAWTGSGPATLVLGDTSFLHDLNSLALSAPGAGHAGNGKGSENPFIILVINNNGGNIFRFLPVSEGQRRPLFQMPHGFAFGGLCQSFGVRYVNPLTETALQDAYNRALSQKGTTVIEVTVPENSAFDELAGMRSELSQSILA